MLVIDPVKRLREAKDSVRLQDALSIEDAIGLYLADNEGVLPAELSGLATSTEYVVVTGSGSSGSNTTSLQFLVDDGYLPELPIDPDLDEDGDDTGYIVTREGDSFTSIARDCVSGVNSQGNTVICSCTELQDMNTNLAGSYLLGRDINCAETVNWNSGAGWEPIGNSSIKFTGTFDGAGYIISNLFINRPSADYISLFGYMESSGALTNISLENVDVTGDTGVAGLVGYNTGNITNSYATGNVTGHNYVGGLVGVNYGNITNSYITGNVTGHAGIGGVVGRNDGTVTNSYATGNIMGDTDVGGLVVIIFLIVI